MMLPSVDPSDAGLDPKRLAAAAETLALGSEAGEYTCAVYLITRHGRTAASGAIGCLGGEESDPHTALDSIFDVASLTKPIATAASLMMLAEQGMISLDQPVADSFSELDLPHLRDTTLKHLAAHTSGLPAWQDLYSQGRSREEAVEQLLGIPQENPVGVRHVYSCLGYIILGLVIERVSSASLAEFARDAVFEPLGMRDTCFVPPKSLTGRTARTANCPGRERVLIGEVQDGNASAMEGVSGNAGLFSTAEDIAVFAQMLLNGGEHEGKRFLRSESVEMMITNQLDPSTGGQGIGFFTKPNPMLAFGESFSARAAGHTGFTGCSLLVDAEHDMSVILLTNRVYLKRDASDYLSRRRLFHDIVASAVK